MPATAHGDLAPGQPGIAAETGEPVRENPSGLLST